MDPARDKKDMTHPHAASDSSARPSAPELSPASAPERSPALAHSLSRPELADLVEQLGEKKFRAGQIWRWQYKDLATRWDDMTNLPAALREKLRATLLDLDSAARVEEIAGRSKYETFKLLLRLSDGEIVETVVIPSKDRHTVCVSCQVGCAFKCAFCASGANGATRSLEAGEIAAQAVLAAREIGARPDNIVFMGMGEPFANYDAAVKAARIMNDPEGLGIGARKITISTCGHVPGIARFADEPEQFELSVSLHAPTQQLREKLMPVAATRWDIAELIESCRAYTAKTNRIITFEYTLVDGVNSSPEHAAALASLLRGLKCRANLIPLNPTPRYPGKPPDRRDSEAFAARLERAGINTTLRRSAGGDLDAACGQLRASRAQQSRAQNFKAPGEKDD